MKCEPFNKNVVIICLLGLSGCNCYWMMTRNGHTCAYECSKEKGTEYNWCYYTSYSWDYCNPYESNKKGNAAILTDSGRFCLSDCAFQGYAFSWCYTSQGTFTWDNWDYCNPKNHVPQPLTTSGQYCNRRCKQGSKDYYWCDTDTPHDDSTWTWDYCSPRPGYSRYDLPCRDDHQCGKHGESYYWCYLKPNNAKGWTWDKCGLPYDKNENLDLAQPDMDFSGNFGAMPGRYEYGRLPEGAAPGHIREKLRRESGRICNETHKRALNNNDGLFQSRTILYRVLSNGLNDPRRGEDEGDASNGIFSRSSRQAVDHFHGDYQPPADYTRNRDMALRHVRNNPDESPFISATANFEVAMRYAAAQSLEYGTSVYVAVIATNLLRHGTIDLYLEDRLLEYLGNSPQAMNYAGASQEALICWYVPPDAIIAVIRLFRNESSDAFDEDVEIRSELGCSLWLKNELEENMHECGRCEIA